MDATMDTEQGRGANGVINGHGHGLDISELSNGAKELANKAREWIVENPMAALGIAVGAGFLFGRAMRMWALR